VSKESQVQAAIDAATQRRAEAGLKHPQVVNPNEPPPLPEDEDDKPVYSTKQLERLLAANINPAASTSSGGLQQASFPALMREIERREKEAQAKLAGIPTRLLETELHRRKKDKANDE